MNFRPILSVYCLFTILLLTSSLFTHSIASGSSPKLSQTLDRQRCRVCSVKRCLRRRVAIRNCRSGCARIASCRVIRDNSCPLRRKRFKCIPRPSSGSTQSVATGCPNICRSAESDARNDCDRLPIDIGCEPVSCVSGQNCGFACGRAAASISPTPSVTPFRPEDCNYTMSSIGDTPFLGTCRCGTDSQNVPLLAPDPNVSSSNPSGCLLDCYGGEFPRLCSAFNIGRFFTITREPMERCCNRCSGFSEFETNTCIMSRLGP